MFADESPEWNVEFDGSESCDECGEVPAVVHLLRVEDGAVAHSRLCQRCAEDLSGRIEGGALVLAVPSTFRHFGVRSNTAETGDPTLTRPESQVCGVCGTTLSDIKETGMVGCSVCYQVFFDYLRSELFGAAQATAHLGKAPKQGSEGDKLRREVLRLQHMLRELVDCERFEEAVSVRDRLAELGQSIGGGAS